MHWKSRGWTLIGMLLLAIPGAMTVMKVTAAAQATSGSAIATTQVTDRGWNTGEWNCDCKLAGVYDGDWPGGAERDDIGDDYRRGFKSAVGAECRIDADGDLLYGGVSPG